MTSDRIKANRAKEVKPASRSGSLFQKASVALFGFGFAFAAYAADTSPPPDLPPPVADAAYNGGTSLDDLSSGDTKRYQVEILKRAGTTPIFLFQNSSHSQPKVGRILLLKKDAEPVMAVRVLRSDAAKKRFAGRAIKFYGTNSKTMKSGEALTVFELSDGSPPPVAPPSVTPDTVPIEPVADPIPPPVEPIPEPAPAPIPEAAPAPVPTPDPAPAPLTTQKAPTAVEPPKVVAPKVPAKVSPPPVPKVPAPTATGTPEPDPTSTPAKKPAAPTKQPPPIRPPVPEIPRPDAGAGPGIDLTAPPPVPDPATPETTIPSTDGSAPPTAPTSKAPAPVPTLVPDPVPSIDSVTSALSAPTQAPAPEPANPSTDAMLQELEVQTAPKADAPPADAPPPDSASQELTLDSAPADAPPPPDPEAPPDPSSVTELDTSALDSQVQENPPVAEGEPPPDTESDAPPPESPEEPPAPEVIAPEEQDDSTLGMAIEEVYPLDPNYQGLTFSFGAFRNIGPPDNPNAVYFFGGGLRYALTLGHMIFAQGSRVQDSFALEPGIFYYKLVNFISAEGGDSFTVLPLIGTLRYTLLFGETFSFFMYGGLMYNYVAQASGPEGQTFDDAKANLGSIIPAIGAGMIFRVGPNWDLRVDLGSDVAQAGLMLRF